ncbi:MAG: hypothetical protein PHE67_00110 [Campylobacterales bacterium]|nr:hypothetical protein [Campylobacterales bacterium]
MNFEHVKTKICHTIFTSISNLVFKCRSPEYAEKMRKAVLHGLEEKRKAEQFSDLKQNQDKLIEATKQFKDYADDSLEKLQSKLELLEAENDILTIQIQTLCIAYINRDYKKVSTMIEALALDFDLVTLDTTKEIQIQTQHTTDTTCNQA